MIEFAFPTLLITVTLVGWAVRGFALSPDCLLVVQLGSAMALSDVLLTLVGDIGLADLLLAAALTGLPMLVLFIRLGEFPARERLGR